MARFLADRAFKPRLAFLNHLKATDTFRLVHGASPLKGYWL